MKITSIDWDVDNDEVVEKITYMDEAEAAKILGISLEEFTNEVVNETLEDFILDKIHHLPALADEIMGLPNEVEVPDGLTNDEDITNWLSDEYGTFLNGYALDSDMERD